MIFVFQTTRGPTHSVRDCYGGSATRRPCNKMVKMYPKEEVKKAKQAIERKKILAELEKYQDDDLLLGPFNSTCKTVPTADNSSKLGKSHCDNLQDESDYTSKINSIDNGYTKLGHTDCNNSESGSVMFIKVVSKDSSVVQPDDNNNAVSTTKLACVQIIKLIIPLEDNYLFVLARWIL